MAELAFQRGLYHRQLLRLLEFFSRSQVLVLQYERCRQFPETELKRTFEFLGIEPLPPAVELSRKVNETRVQKPTLSEYLGDSLAGAYADETRRLLAEFPELDPTLWPSAPD